MALKRDPGTVDLRSLGKQLGLSWLQAGALVAFSAVVALSANWLRGGLPLRRRAPFDLYTDCPEIAEGIQSKDVGQLKTGSRGVVYLDARMAQPYCKGHIPGARFLPCYETEPVDPDEVNKLKKLKGRWLVVYGDKKLLSGKRLVSALMQAHVRGVYLLKGGLEAWRKAGRPLRKCVPESLPVAAVGKLEGKVVYVDAREKEAFDAGRLPGAVLLTYDGVLPPETAVLKRLEKMKADHFVVYGSGQPAQGQQAGVPAVNAAVGAASEMKARGMGNVKILEGGYQAWVQAGRPVEKSGGSRSGPRHGALK